MLKEYMLCKQESFDPRACLKEGKEVTSCAQRFFKVIKQHCDDEFKTFYTCLHKYGGRNYSYKNCRAAQLPFDNCMKTRAGLERPDMGYFNRVRLHKTSRPPPQPAMAPMPERLPDLPDFKELPEPERLAQRRRVNDWLL